MPVTGVQTCALPISLTASRLIYPELPIPITAEALRKLFTPTYDEQRWAESLARTVMARVVLLTQLKVFQFLGRFAPVTDIPANVIEHIMAKLGTVAALPLAIGENRL